MKINKVSWGEHRQITSNLTHTMHQRASKKIVLLIQCTKRILSPISWSKHRTPISAMVQAHSQDIHFSKSQKMNLLRKESNFLENQKCTESQFNQNLQVKLLIPRTNLFKTHHWEIKSLKHTKWIWNKMITILQSWRKTRQWGKTNSSRILVSEDHPYPMSLPKTQHLTAIDDHQHPFSLQETPITATEEAQSLQSGEETQFTTTLGSACNMRTSLSTTMINKIKCVTQELKGFPIYYLLSNEKVNK